jgi:pullulanase/glycogen debranching enzyme
MTALPFGARLDDCGVSFAVFSSVADAVEVCLFDDAGTEKSVGRSNSTHRGLSFWPRSPSTSTRRGATGLWADELLESNDGLLRIACTVQCTTTV